MFFAKTTAELIAQNGLGAGGLGGLQTVSKQSGRSFLHPAAAAVAMAVGPQPKITCCRPCLGRLRHG